MKIFPQLLLCKKWLNLLKPISYEVIPEPGSYREFDFIPNATDNAVMEGINNSVQNPYAILELTLKQAQNQGSELAQKLIKLNAAQQIDVSQLSYMGNLVDMYV